MTVIKDLIERMSMEAVGDIANCVGRLDKLRRVICFVLLL